MNVNEKHKNSVFIKLFSDPEALRELYSAIEGINIPHDAKIEINTLSDIFFKEQINDVSFLIDDKLVVLIEHQSTINDNMPIRLLEYIGREYEQIVDHIKLFQRKLVKIPTPEFIVLYNGIMPYPEKNELRLSTAFMDVNDLKKQNTVSLELIVHVYNINYGQNKRILEKCKNLNGYSLLNEKIREGQKTKTLENSIKSAIKWCSDNNVLKDFLRIYGSEVTNMFMMNLSTDELVKISCEEAREDGWEEGLEKGREKGREEGLEEGWKGGWKEGHEKGWEEGIIKVAGSLKRIGNSIEMIQTVTGLSPEKIEKL